MGAKQGSVKGNELSRWLHHGLHHGLYQFMKKNLILLSEGKINSINLSDFFKETSTQLITKSGDFTQKVIEVTFKRRLFTLN